MKFKIALLIIFTSIALTASVIIWQKNASYSKKLDEMALEVVYEYLVDVRDDNFNEVKNARLFANYSKEVSKNRLTLLYIKKINAWTRLKRFSNEEIKSKLKVIKLEDHWRKMNYIVRISEGTYKFDLDRSEIRIVLFDNDDRSVVLFTYYYENKMLILEGWDEVSKRYTKGKNNSEDSSIRYMDNGIFFDIHNHIIIDTYTGEKWYYGTYYKPL